MKDLDFDDLLSEEPRVIRVPCSELNVVLHLRDVGQKQMQFIDNAEHDNQTRGKLLMQTVLTNQAGDTLSAEQVDHILACRSPREVKALFKTIGQFVAGEPIENLPKASAGSSATD